MAFLSEESQIDMKELKAMTHKSAFSTALGPTGKDSRGWEFPTSLFLAVLFAWIRLIGPGGPSNRDLENFRHIEIGRWILEHRSLPAADFLSWSKAGEPYQLTQWGGEALMALAYDFAGWYGTLLLGATITTLTLFFAWSAARRYVAPLPALVVAILCNLELMVLPMRPQLFSFLGMALLSLLVVSWRRTESRKPLYLIPVVMALWANLHGGFVVGVAFLMVFTFGLWLESVKAGSVTLLDRSAITMALATSAAFVATLLNPYGIDAWVVVAKISQLQSSKYIPEWHPVNVTTLVGWFYMILLGAYLTLLLQANKRPKLSEGLSAGFLLFFAVVANRNVPLAGAALAPFVAALLAQCPQYSLLNMGKDPSRKILYPILTVLLLSSISVFWKYAHEKQMASLNQTAPIDAVNFLKERALTERVLNESDDCGYLISNGIPVFIDGRMDLYEDKGFFEHYHAMNGGSSWKRFIDDAKPLTLLLRNETALRQIALASGMWEPVYEDGAYSVLVRSGYRPDVRRVPSVGAPGSANTGSDANRKD